MSLRVISWIVPFQAKKAETTEAKRLRLKSTARAEHLLVVGCVDLDVLDLSREADVIAKS